MKLQSFCTTKEMVSKLKRPPTEWEKIFASYISDKGMKTKIYRKLNKLNFQKINDSIKKWATELTELFQRIPRWRPEGGSRKRTSYSEILEKCWRHILQARRGKILTPPHNQLAQRISTSC
jgi:hypothetical protein